MKKKFSETKVGKFLKQVAPHLFSLTASMTPTNSILNAIKSFLKWIKQKCKKLQKDGTQI